MKRVTLVAGLHLIALGAVVAVVACVAQPPVATQAPPPAAAPAPPPPVARDVQPVAPPPMASASHCDAASLAYLVGRPRTEIPVPVDPSSRRVSCTSCPVTQDYQPGRTDILFDAQSGLITAVKCG